MNHLLATITVFAKIRKHSTLNGQTFVESHFGVAHDDPLTKGHGQEGTPNQLPPAQNPDNLE
jgi:hypothetical protein